MRRKYTKEILAPIVKESLSISEVLRKLGLAVAGGTHYYISNIIKEYKLDTSHFLGSRANSGSNHKGGPSKRPPNDILVLRSVGYRAKTKHLVRALKEIGRSYVCEVCGNKGIWNKKLLMLQVNHINGNWLDDRLENLQFLCPNCHSQTPGWCRRLDSKCLKRRSSPIGSRQTA